MSEHSSTSFTPLPEDERAAGTGFRRLSFIERVFGLSSLIYLAAFTVLHVGISMLEMASLVGSSRLGRNYSADYWELLFTASLILGWAGFWIHRFVGVMCYMVIGVVFLILYIPTIVTLLYSWPDPPGVLAFSFYHTSGGLVAAIILPYYVIRTDFFSRPNRETETDAVPASTLGPIP